MTFTKLAQKSLIIAGIALSPLCLASEPLYEADPLASNIADDDKDGVINVRDFCPETLAGAKVDNDGCPSEDTKQFSVNLRVLFDTGRYEVKPQYYSEIKKVADFLYANPQSTAVIEGHTDNVGEDANNLALSRNRANEIALVLIRQFGVDRNRIRGIGYGETRPIASNDTADGRLQNRRVVATMSASQTMEEKRWNIYSVDNDQSTESSLSPASSIQFNNGSAPGW